MGGQRCLIMMKARKQVSKLAFASAIRCLCARYIGAASGFVGAARLRFMGEVSALQAPPSAVPAATSPSNRDALSGQLFSLMVGTVSL